MNIQLSVIIWTVICFTLVMLILKNWLFLPVLKILDERHKKLSESRAKAIEYKQLEEEYNSDFEKQKLEHALKKQSEIQSTVSQIQADEKNQVKVAHTKCLENIDIYRDELQKSREQIITVATPKIKEIAEIFAQKILP